MGDLKLASIEHELREAFARLAPEGARLMLVASVHDWAGSNGLVEHNAFRQAVAFPNALLVVMNDSVSTVGAESSSSLLTIGPLTHDALARDLRLYALFLLMHEIAHLHGATDEPSADTWALATLAAYLEERGERALGITWSGQ